MMIAEVYTVSEVNMMMAEVSTRIAEVSMTGEVYMMMAEVSVAGDG